MAQGDDVFNVRKKKTGDDPDEMGSGPVKSYYVLRPKRPSQEPENFFGQRKTDIELPSPHAQGDWKTPGRQQAPSARDAQQRREQANRNGLRIKSK